MSRKTLLVTAVVVILAVGAWVGAHQLWRILLRMHGH